MKHLSRFTSLVQVAAMLYLAFTGQLFQWCAYVIVPQVMALVLVLWARFSFPAGQFSFHADPAGSQLVTGGPYRWIRHPMYTSGQLLLWPGILSHLSPVTLAVGVIVMVFIAARVMTEEPMLIEKVPGYAEYARRTKRFIPYVF